MVGEVFQYFEKLRSTNYQDNGVRGPLGRLVRQAFKKTPPKKKQNKKKQGRVRVIIHQERRIIVRGPL